MADRLDEIRDVLERVWRNGYAHGHQDGEDAQWRPHEAKNRYGARLELDDARRALEREGSTG